MMELDEEEGENVNMAEDQEKEEVKILTFEEI